MKATSTFDPATLKKVQELQAVYGITELDASGRAFIGPLTFAKLRDKIGDDERCTELRRGYRGHCVDQAHKLLGE